MIQTGNWGQGRRGIISTESPPVKQNSVRQSRRDSEGRAGWRKWGGRVSVYGEEQVTLLALWSLECEGHSRLGTGHGGPGGMCSRARNSSCNQGRAADAL